MDKLGDGREDRQTGGEGKEKPRADAAVMEPDRPEGRRAVPAEQMETVSAPETGTGTDPRDSTEDDALMTEGEVMSNLPRRRPHHRTIRRHQETVRRQKAAARSRRRAASASARTKPARPMRTPGAGPTGADLGFVGQVAGQAARLTVDAASLGLRLAGGILKRLAGQDEQPSRKHR